MTESRSKLMILGHGRHGKDTVCEVLRDYYGYTFESSSKTAVDHFIYDALKKVLGYKSKEQCYCDRSNHRALWFELIKAINHKDKTTLGRKIYDSNDIYCGIRNKSELDALKEAGLIDLTIWVDASDRLCPEDAASCTVTKEDADIILNNNGTLEDLHTHIDNLMQVIGVEPNDPHTSKQQEQQESDRVYRGVPNPRR